MRGINRRFLSNNTSEIHKRLKLQKIIYTSPNKIDWDAQSAFKLTNYYTEDENCMVFCYLKQYVENGNLKICTFCFDKEAQGKNGLQLCFNLNPEVNTGFIAMDFGIDGISAVSSVCAETNSVNPICADEEGIDYHSFKSNDQQGFYWCGEITLSNDFIRRHFCTALEEKSIIVLNLYKLFPGREDYACLFPDPYNNILTKGEYMQEFVVLKY